MREAVALFDGAGTPADERRDFLAMLALPPGSKLVEAVDGTIDERDGSCDAILCVDAIARVPDRAATLASWARALKPGGRVLYTDPAIVAGLVTSEEVAIRSRLGFLVLAPQGENEGLIESAGFRLLRADDASDPWALEAHNLGSERSRREAELVAGEGRERYDAVQRFLDVSHRLAASRRLARIAFLAEKTP